MLTSGTVVAGYRIERVLGTGGMGAVYVVANPELPRRDALKVLSSELSHNDEFRTRFVREADVASMLDHPNIVSIYRRGQTHDGLLWIAMQFVDGTDADAALKAGAMTPQRAVHITAEVAKALDFAHAHSVVHRDVKPANFLLSGPVGPDERVLLGDFGIARAYDDAGLTATGSLVATIAYAAPEVLTGGAIDGRADLYSLGCTLFRLITGKTPYSTANGMPAVMMAHLQAPPPRVTDHAPGLPTALDAVIAKAMAKDPAHRFSSARELADAAARSLHDRTTSAKTAPWQPIPAAAVTSYPQMSGDVTPWWQQDAPHTRPGFAAIPTQHGPPQHGLPYAPTPPRRRRRALVLAALAAAVGLAGTAAGVIAISRHHGDQHNSAAPSTTQITASGPAAPLAPKVLDGLLLPPDQVAQLMGASQLAIFKSVDSLIDESSVIDPKTCIGAFAPAENSVYADTGWTAARVQAVHEPGPVPIAFEILQSVVELPTAAAAQKLFNDQSAEWSGCANTDYTATYPDTAPARWKFGDVTKTDNAMSIPQRWTGPGMPQTGTCQRALQVQNNVLIDVWACRLGISNQGVDLAKAIAAKLPQ